MTTPDFDRLARLVDDAAREVRAIPQLSAEDTFTLADAYEIQRRSIARRVERGARRVGVKMGFTSLAKQAQMGVSTVIWGRLTDGMGLQEHEPLDLSRFIHPRIEPEVAFLLGRDLVGEVTLPEAFAAVDGVAAAMEVIDSRYERFEFSLPDVVADNASSSGFVIGPWRSPRADLTNCGVVMRFAGRPAQIGSTAAILGNPWRSLVEAARRCALAGEPLKAGWIVMAGGATAASWVEPRVRVSTEIEGLGRVEVRGSDARDDEGEDVAFETKGRSDGASS